VTNGPYKNSLQKDVTHEGILTHELVLYFRNSK